ncbi:MAG: VOC family protein [Ilumatobacteraceae bacterium]|jgi:glyoxylase I family protein
MALALATHHVSLSVRDLDRSIGFWSGVVGLETIPRPDMGVQGVWLGVGDTQLHLIVYDESRGDVGAQPGSINAAAPHVAFAVDDYARTVAHLRDAGLDVVEAGPRRGQCWVQDPDGYVVEFIVAR